MKEIVLSGEIGWEIVAADVRKQIDSVKGEPLEICIASPGGSVFAGIEIYNIITGYRRNFPSSWIGCKVVGICASMASYIACNPAFNRVAAEDNAVFMIHNAWGGIQGDKNEMKKYASILDNIDTLLAAAYVNRTGKSVKEIKKLMDEETWFFGSEIKEAGFVDDILPGTGETTGKAAAIISAKSKYSATAAKIGEDFKIAAQVMGSGLDITAGPSTPSGSGIIADERSLMEAVNSSRRERGLDVVTSDDILPGNQPAGIISDEASMKREVERARRMRA